MKIYEMKILFVELQFDMEEEEDLGFTFHETSVADHTDTRL